MPTSLRKECADNPLLVIEDHRKSPPAKADLMQVMLTGRDKETGLGLSDEAVGSNVRTYLYSSEVTLTLCSVLLSLSLVS